MQAADREPCSALLPAVKSSGIPVLLVRATEPPEYESIRAPASERFRAALAGAELIALPEPGTTSSAKRPPEVGRILLDWL